MTRKFDFSSFNSLLIFVIGMQQVDVFNSCSDGASNPLGFQSIFAVASTIFFLYLLIDYYIKNRKAGRKVKRIFLLLCLVSSLLLPIYAIDFFHSFHNVENFSNTVDVILFVVGILYFFILLVFAMSEALQVLQEKNK
ncbi:MAG: hypothetical protein FWG63_01665 [Defluviitaleaceae bacterium]|nr:hypothetical protein [Defluviitaleaceae bacterium]